MTSIEKLKEIVKDKTIGIISMGPSLNELEQNIEFFRDKPIIWVGFNYNWIIEKFILNKINKYLDISCNFGILGDWKNGRVFEETIRIPHLVKAIDKNRFVVVSKSLIQIVYNTLGLEYFYEKYKDNLYFLEDLQVYSSSHPGNSFSQIIGFILRCQPKKVILFGLDGYRKKDHLNKDNVYYKQQEIFSIFKELAECIETKENMLEYDSVIFEQKGYDYCKDVCIQNGLPLPTIINCSPTSIFTKFKKINYKELINEEI